MIKNEKQYKITNAKIKDFAQSVSILDQEIDKNHDPLLELERDALRGQIFDLQRELEEYEDLKAGNIPILEFINIEDLPKTLIKSRIALGLSQKDLAEKMRLQEQQIQRYEHTDYESASYTRLEEVFEALALEKEKIDFSPQSDLKSVLKKLSSVGLDPNFITKRIIPNSSLHEDNLSTSNVSNIQSIARLEKIFGWTSEQILGDEPLTIKPIEVKFKMPKNANHLKVHAYSVFAHYVAMLLVQATKGLEKKSIPDNPYRLRDDIASNMSTISFKNLVQYVWKLGIPVISLDPLSFHAACFSDDSGSVIVLTQNTKSEARWMFDLLHELYHVITGTERIDFDDDFQDSKDESDANKFAHAVLLGKNIEKILNSCLDKCLVNENWNFAYLKKAVIDVANKEKVRIDILANYVAYRLSTEGLCSWWGVAEKLQTPMHDARIIIRDEILRYSDFTLLSEPDLELLTQNLEVFNQ